jgi:hypothetical protein
LAFFHNFLDGSSDATGKDGVGHFAKQLQFSHCPSGFASVFHDGGNYSQSLIARFELIYDIQISTASQLVIAHQIL